MLDTNEPFGLTKREREVLELLVDGVPYNEIARQLDISRRTVGNHVVNIYRENMQRADMVPIDKARGFSILTERYGSVNIVSKQTGMSVSTIRKYLTLVRLPESVAAEFTVADGSASVSVATAIATTFTDPEEMREAWDKMKGLKAGIAEQVIRNSAGDMDQLEESKLLALEGAFDIRRWGSSLATCPYVPNSARGEILRMASEAK